MSKKLKAILAIFLVIIMLPILPVNIFAAEEAKSIGDYFTDAETFEKTEVGGVIAYKLLKDIAVEKTYETEFVGILDGNGNTVTTSVPLFATLASGATVQNLTIAGAINETETSHVGALARQIAESASNVSIKNITNNATVTVSACNDQQSVGGLIGYFTNASVKLELCVNNGNVEVPNGKGGSKRPYVGGLVGRLDKSTVEYSACSNNGNIIGNSVTGGFAGYVSGGNSGSLTMRECVNTGSVSTVNDGGMTASYHYCTAGGFVGAWNSKALKITSSANFGAINAQSTGVGTTAHSATSAGFVVSTDAAAIREPVINNCISVGEITATGYGTEKGYAALIFCEYHGNASGTWDDAKRAKLTYGNYVASDTSCSYVANGNDTIGFAPVSISRDGYDYTVLKDEVKDLNRYFDSDISDRLIEEKYVKAADGKISFGAQSFNVGGRLYGIELSILGGASIRRRSDNGCTGIRFQSVIKQLDYDVLAAAVGEENIEIGTLFTTETKLGNGRFTHEALGSGNYAEAIRTEQGFTEIERGEIEGYYTIRGSLLNIDFENVSEPIYARAYIKVGEKYYYSHNYTFAAVRDIAEAAMNSGDYSQNTESNSKWHEFFASCGVDDRLDIYPEFPEQIIRDYTYSVSVVKTNDESTKTQIPVYNHTMNSPQSANYDDADGYRRFATFAFCGTQVRVDIKVNTDFTEYTVMPSEKNFKSEFNSETGIISVYLDKPEYFLIRLDGKDSTVLSVMVDAVDFKGERYAASSDSKITKIESWQDAETADGVLNITGYNQVVYIAPGAVLNARLSVSGRNVKLCGRGAVLDPYSDIFEYDINASPDKWIIRLDSDNILVDGIHMLDSREFNIGTSKHNTVIKNIKIFSSVISSDGIGLTATDATNNKIEHCFVYCGDNALVFSAKDFVCRDITVGTTCSVLYPQGSPEGIFEGMHVFRADASNSGLFRNIYNDEKNQQTMNITVNDLYAVDCTRLSGLFYGEKMGTANKTVTFNNVQIRTEATAIIKVGYKDIDTSNYNITINGLIINGERITTWSDTYTSFYSGSVNTVNFNTDTSTGISTVNTSTESYAATDKVYIGNRQVFLGAPVINNAGVYKLPYEQLCKELNVMSTVETEIIDGVLYVASNKLVAAGMALYVEVKDDRVYIIPKPSNNILKPDTEKVSNFTEAWASTSDLITNHNRADAEYISTRDGVVSGIGIARIINEEVQKYGKGKYILTFYAKQLLTETGSYENLSVALRHGSTDVVSTVYNNLNADEFTKCEFMFDVTDTYVSATEQIALMFSMKKGAAEDYFSIKDISLGISVFNDALADVDDATVDGSRLFG